MAISINWLTKVISVPQSDLTSLGGSAYSLDVDWFRLSLKNLEDSDEGMIFPITHNHNPPVTLGGAVYARQVEIINGYTVSFQDTGTPYSVSLDGANNNIQDVANLITNVSIRSNNSAGLVQVTGGSGLSVEQAQMLEELWRLAGLKLGEPMTVTPTSRTSGDIELEITGDGVTTSTVTRQ